MGATHKNQKTQNKEVFESEEVKGGKVFRLCTKIFCLLGYSYN